MVAKNLPAALEETWGHEGGLSLDRNDRGNWTTGKIGQGALKGTKYGIAAHAYPNLDIRNLTRDQAAEIYRRDYWGAVRGDELPGGPDVVAFDGAINCGPGRAIKWLQKAVGVTADGGFGPLTMNAVRAVTNWVEGVKRIRAYRLSFLQALSSWARYGDGWSTRVARVEAFGIRLALEAGGRAASPVLALEAVGAEKSRRRNRRAAQATGGATAADGAGAVETTTAPPIDAVMDPSILPAILIALAIAGIVAVGFFVWRSHVQKQRAGALRNEAAAKSRGTI